MISRTKEVMNLPKKNMNFRDCGGYLTSDGKRIRKGILYRSGHLDHLKGKELNQFLSLGIRTIIDLRSSAEIKKDQGGLAGTQTINLPINSGETLRKKLKPFIFRENTQEYISNTMVSAYAGFVIEQRQILRTIFEILLTPDYYPILIHCQGGKDRTGFVCAVIQLALGVESSTVVQDYLLSNQYLLPKVQRAMKILKIVSLGFLRTKNLGLVFLAHEKYIKTVFDTINKNFGGIEQYLETCGLTGKKLMELNYLILE